MPSETVKEWMAKAERDFAVACREMRAMKSPNYDAVCFQAAEKQGKRAEKGTSLSGKGAEKGTSMISTDSIISDGPFSHPSNGVDMKSFQETLRGHGHPIFARDGFRCIYCGLDGRDFLSWMQLSLDHIIPKNAGGDNTQANLATCCRSCNSITSRMTFDPGTTREQAIAAKKAAIQKSPQRLFDVLEG